MKSAYISCPMTIPIDTLNDVIGLVRNANVNYAFWKRGTKYDEDIFTSIIESCEAFIIILPSVAWSCSLDEMTSGSRKELLKAIHMKKLIFIAYSNRNEGLGLYSADIKRNLDCVIGITGIAATRYNFFDIIGSTTKEQLVSEYHGRLKRKEANWLELYQKEWEKRWSEDYRRLEERLWTNGPIKINMDAINPSKDLEDILSKFQTTGNLFLNNSSLIADIVLVVDRRLNLFF